MADLDELGIPYALPDRAEFLTALELEDIALHYGANPLEVREWDAEILRHRSFVLAFRSLGASAATTAAAGDDGSVW